MGGRAPPIRNQKASVAPIPRPDANVAVACTHSSWQPPLPRRALRRSPSKRSAAERQELELRTSDFGLSSGTDAPLVGALNSAAGVSASIFSAVFESWKGVTRTPVLWGEARLCYRMYLRRARVAAPAGLVSPRRPHSTFLCLHPPGAKTISNRGNGGTHAHTQSGGTHAQGQPRRASLT